MKPFINRSAISKTRYRSDEVSVLSYTAHLISEEGSYHGTISKNGNLLKTFEIRCTKQCSDQQLNIDLADLKNDTGALLTDEKLAISPNGYVLLFDSFADDAYQVRIDKSTDDKKSRKEFESKQLNANDLYTVILLRPGEYTASNLKDKTSMKVVVAYPEPAEKSKVRKQLEPTTIGVGKDGFSEKSVEVMPGQPLVFRISDKALVEIVLKKPNDKKVPVRKTKKGKGREIRKSIRLVRKKK